GLSAGDVSLHLLIGIFRDALVLNYQGTIRIIDPTEKEGFEPSTRLYLHCILTSMQLQNGEGGI
ncbi:MAG: hypothetical protein IKI46_06545, partial [Lachnospiraceae bacterium]|nr:hypothetical protein [Lachnospiraceae bacterium]